MSTTTSPGTAARSEELLTAPYVLEYAYRRSTGPVLGAFLQGLLERRVLGARLSDGVVLVPPAEYDPRDGSAAGEELVEVGPGGIVKTWSWVPEPRPQHPLDRPFAWALVELDGADTGMLHAVDCGSPAALATGARVRIRWAAERTGCIADIACFELEASP